MSKTNLITLFGVVTILKVVSYHTKPKFDHWTKEMSYTNTARDFKFIASYP